MRRSRALRLTWAVAVLGLFGAIYAERLRRRSQVVESSVAEVSHDVTRPIAAPPPTSTPGVENVAPPQIPTAVNGVPQLDPSSIVPRPAGEWQGMPIDRARQAACDTTDRCSLARACRDGHCGACELDEECLVGEACVLQHCILETKVGCRSRASCKTKELCILSGYSAGPRGNEDLRSYCNPFRGGREQIEQSDAHGHQDFRPPSPGRVKIDEMRAELRFPNP
jgi:hypothetical protein